MMTLLRNGMAFLRSGSAKIASPRVGSQSQSSAFVGWAERSEAHRQSGGGDGLRYAQPILRVVLRLGADEVADQGVGLGLPAAAVEDAVMADAGLQVMQLFLVREVMAEKLRGGGLAGAANVVALAFDRHQGGLFDRAGIDRLAMHFEGAVRQIVALKHAFEGLEIEFGRQIHDRAVFVVKGAGRRGVVVVALDKLLKHPPMRRDMAVEIHAEKAGKLQKPGIDPPA